MITRDLKSTEFTYDTQKREFTVTKFYADQFGGAAESITLTKSQMGAFVRFGLSMFQFHPKKHD